MLRQGVVGGCRALLRRTYHQRKTKSFFPISTLDTSTNEIDSTINSFLTKSPPEAVNVDRLLANVPSSDINASQLCKIFGSLGNQTFSFSVSHLQYLSSALARLQPNLQRGQIGNWNLGFDFNKYISLGQLFVSLRHLRFPSPQHFALRDEFENCLRLLLSSTKLIDSSALISRSKNEHALASIMLDVLQTRPTEDLANMIVDISTEQLRYQLSQSPNAPTSCSNKWTLRETNNALFGLKSFPTPQVLSPFPSCGCNQ